DHRAELAGPHHPGDQRAAGPGRALRAAAARARPRPTRAAEGGRALTRRPRFAQGAERMRHTRFFKPEHAGLMHSPSWLRCEKLIKAFEEAWRREQAPRIADYLHAEG